MKQEEKMEEDKNENMSKGNIMIETNKKKYRRRTRKQNLKDNLNKI